MKLKKLGAFAATGAMALALALTGCGSSNATSGSDAGSSSSDDAKVEKVDGSKARQGRYADRRHLCRVRAV